MTRTAGIAVVAVLAGAGCTKGGEQAPARKAAPEPAAEKVPELRVELGECAAANARFVSRAFPERLASALAWGGLLGNEIGEMQGGFGYGRVGTGPGGGTGIGTIGTGRSGTIGHGRGPGSGYGIGGGRRGMARRQDAVPQVLIGKAEAAGGLDKNIIRRYIRRRLPQIRYCYEKRLLVVKDLAGQVDIDFTIDAGGLVETSSGSGMDPEVSSCVAGAIKSVQFPKPPGGGAVSVRYPFHFRPAGSTPPTAAAAAPPPALDEVALAGGLSPVPAGNPLRGHEQLLADCFRKQPATHGAAVIELDIDAAGAVESASVHGPIAGDFPACVAAALKPVAMTGAQPGARRCPVAFGTMPIDQAPAVDITADAVTMGGKRMTDVASIVADAATDMRLATLDDAVEAQKAAAGSSDQAALRVFDPILLRPIDATPMKVVARAWYTLASADVDFLPAAQKGSGWRLLRDVAVPAVPAPVGVGGILAEVMASPPGERPVASLLVRKDQIWIGTTKGAPPVTVAAGADQAARLGEALRALKQSPEFASRRDLEVAAEDDAIYGQLVGAIDAANQAGFTDWMVTAPATLSAMPAR
jgi:hypothetical protein